MRLLKTVIAFSLTVLIMGAGSAEAGKHKKKDPKYTASMSISAHMSARIDCEEWTSNWVYDSSYYPTTLETAASFDSRARTASGTVDYNDLCSLESGSCSVTAISPEPGIHAGDEDAVLWKATGGLRVDVEFTQFLEITGTNCGGAIYTKGAEGGTESDPEGFIPTAQIGKKHISVPIAGSFSLIDGSEHSEGQMNGTLTLTRKGKKKGNN